MNKRIGILISLLFIFAVLTFGAVTPVEAAESESVYEPFVVVSTYKVTNDIINPGKSFELTIVVENTDEKTATRGLLVSLVFPDGINTEYGSSNQIVLNSLEPGEKREISFKLYASPYYSKSTVTFGITFTSEVRTSTSYIYAPVQLDMTSFKVVSQSIPEEVEAGEKIAASLSFKSVLEEKLSNVVLSVYVDRDSSPIASVNIGNITAGASKTQSVTFFINETGRHTLRFDLSYSMAEGDYSTVELYSGKILVNEPSETEYVEDNNVTEEELSGQDKLIILGCLGLSVLLGIGIVLIAKKYN